MSRAEPTSKKASMAGFAIDLDHLRRNARAHIEEGPITEAYGADRDRVVAVLNEVLATELVCARRYKRHYYMADGPYWTSSTTARWSTRLATCAPGSSPPRRSTARASTSRGTRPSRPGGFLVGKGVRIEIDVEAIRQADS